MNTTTFSAPATGIPQRLTVDAPTRMTHALMALCFAGAYLTAEGERWRLVHVTLGYTVLALLAWRVLWGLFGPKQARLSLLWSRVRGFPTWLRGFTPNLAQARQGMNLMLGASVIALLLLMLLAGASGWSVYNEVAGAGLNEALGEVHEFMGNGLLAVVLLHLSLIVGVSVLKRRNQAAVMFTGRVEGRGPDLVRHNRPVLAGALLAAVLMFWTWQWYTAPTATPGAPTQHHATGHDD